MAVDEPNSIDFVSTAADRTVTLSVSDHLPWSAETEHLTQLEAKLNRYMDFINSGELVDKFPDTADHRPFIRIHFMHAPTPAAELFLVRASAAIEQEGVGFTYGLISTPQ